MTSELKGANDDNASLTYYIEMSSPIGPLAVTSDGASITGLYMETHKHGPLNRDGWVLDATSQVAPLSAARAQLEEYFRGERTNFDLPLNATGTVVQKSVWQALTRIPYGATRSYGQIAAEIGNPKASRAVGAANGRNPISIIVPCHRVIGANGALTGFGGGVERKEWLLAHEAKVNGTPTSFRHGDLFST